MPALTVVVLGSFRKHLGEIMEAVRAFEANGFRVLSPRQGKARNPGAEFVLLEEDGEAGPREVADRVMAEIDRADLVYFVCPGGYMGASAAFELGYCVARGKAVFVSERPADVLLAMYGSQAARPDEVRHRLQG